MNTERLTEDGDADDGAYFTRAETAERRQHALASLDAFRAPEPERETFRVTDLHTAVWAARKLRKPHAQKAANQALADAEIARIKAWLERENAALDGEIAYFEGLLAPWVLHEIAGRKAKSVKLPGATLGYREQPKTVAYDDQKLLAWAKTHEPAWIRVKEEIAKTAVKEAVLRDHQVVRDDAGVVLVETVEQPAKFSVKFTDTTEEGDAE